jgi:indole-3-acetate monooxygenase
MTTITASTALGELRGAIDRLAPSLRARSAEIESARRLPRDLLDDLDAAGCFRLALPRSHAGLEATLPDALDVYEALARADASVGWLVMIGSGNWIDVANMPRPTFDAVVGTGERLAGVFSPSGTVEATTGGYVASGRWAFASGCDHATWIYLNCIDPQAEAPHIRTVVLPVDEVEIEDTWRVAGLRGTGSHHVRVDGVVVPAERTSVLQDPYVVDTTLLRLPPPAIFSQCVAAVAVGTAHGALDELGTVAGERTPLLAADRLVTSPLYQHDLARADAHLRAARALLHEQAAELWATAEAGKPLTLAQRGRMRAGAVTIVDQAIAVTDTAFRAGGGRAIYDEHPLQRRLRDIHTLGQHFLVRPDTLVTAGRALSGQEPDVPIF